MYRATFPQQGEPDGRGMIWSVLVALATGTLIGVLVAVPYDQLFGLSAPLCTALRSLVTTVTLVSLRTVDRAEWTVETDHLP